LFSKVAQFHRSILRRRVPISKRGFWTLLNHCGPLYGEHARAIVESWTTADARREPH
jgi:hypothetical protein